MYACVLVPWPDKAIFGVHTDLQNRVASVETKAQEAVVAAKKAEALVREAEGQSIFLHLHRSWRNNSTGSLLRCSTTTVV